MQPVGGPSAPYRHKRVKRQPGIILSFPLNKILFFIIGHEAIQIGIYHDPNVIKAVIYRFKIEVMDVNINV